ncbi:uncharacterized protein ACRADG_009538 [Cochliomyia hominivorax]
MEGCILCLEINKELIDAITINSKEWHELNVLNLIEKHLWSMEYLRNFNWLCSNCWKELLGFHKFYQHIKETHIQYGLLSKHITDAGIVLLNDTLTERNDVLVLNETENTNVNLTNFEKNPINECSENVAEELKNFLNNLENEINIDEHKILIKDEVNEEPVADKINLFKKRKRGRPRQEITNNTTITKPKKYKPRKCKEMTLKETPSENRNSPATSEIKTEFELHSQMKDVNISLNGNSDSEPFEPIKIKSSYTSKSNRNAKDTFLAENFKITCFICNIPLETFFAMRKHFEVKHNERGHVKCCNKKIYRRSILVDHVHRHLDPDYFKCRKCGKVMADRRCLELHIETHESNQEKSHCCDICGKGFAKLCVLKKHRMIHLSEDEKRFPCTECGKNFGSNYLLTSHYRYVHLKKYVKICDICGKSIRSKDVFERHMLQHQGKAAPIETCDICGLILTDRKALKRHKDMIHPEGGKQEYTCTICLKISPNLRAHKRHVQYKHIMCYDHKCTICGKAFKKAQTLREHMASHTGTVLYTCPWCPKTFNSNANMHNHRKKVHPKEWEEASRKRYSGNLPPNFKSPLITETTDISLPPDL